MSITEIYTPGLALLSKSGVSLTLFRPEPEDADFLLCRTALETSSIKSPLSYYLSEHPGLCLLRLKSGSLLFTALPSGHSSTLSERGLYLFSGRRTCRILVRDRAEYDILYFDGMSLPCFCRHLPQEAPFWQVSQALSWSGELLPLFAREEANPILCHMLLTCLLSRPALEYMLPGKKVPPYLADMKSKLETCYYEDYGLVQLEEMYHVNRYRLCREFRLHYQTSPLQYLHKMRIQAAKNLLTETNMKIHEIGYEVGYENVNHFIAHFKKNTGMTPTQYRQQGLPFPAVL